MIDFFNDTNEQIKKIKKDIEYQKDELAAIIKNKDIEKNDATFKGVLASVRRISDSYGDDLEKIAIYINNVGELNLKKEMTCKDKKMILGMLDELYGLYYNTISTYDNMVFSATTFSDFTRKEFGRECWSNKIYDLRKKWKEIVKEDLIESSNKNKSENSFNKVIKRLNKVCDEEEDSWSKEYNELDKYIKKEKNKRIKELDKKIQEIEKEFLDLHNDIESKKNKLEQDNIILNKEFNKLGILNLIKKEKVKKNIIENNRLIFRYNEELNKLKQDYEDKKEKFTQENEKEKIKIQKEIRETMVTPKSPYNIIDWLTRKYNSPENNIISLKRKIRNILSKYTNFINAKEIMNQDEDLIAVGETEVRNILNKMVSNQEADRFYNNEHVYKAIPESKKIIRDKKLLDSQTKTEFSIQRNKVYETLKTLDKGCDLMKELRDKFSDLKEFRIYQILNSLENDGVRLEYQDGILIFDLNIK